jgi:putative flippase GtrA
MTVQFQTEPKYRSIAYGANSIYESACGPASLCNALRASGIAKVRLTAMCRLAVSCGARVDGGTDMAALLRGAAAKYGFAWKATSQNAELLAHLQAGGTAILHAGSAYKLFSNAGHFVAAAAAAGETITVLDSYWYEGKYTSTTLRKNNVKVLSKGVITTSLAQCGKATADRSPSYYLIGAKSKTVTTVSDVSARAANRSRSTKLGVLRKGKTLPVLEMTENWVKVPVWIARKYTK